MTNSALDKATNLAQKRDGWDVRLRPHGVRAIDGKPPEIKRCERGSLTAESCSWMDVRGPIVRTCTTVFLFLLPMFFIWAPLFRA